LQLVHEIVQSVFGYGTEQKGQLLIENIQTKVGFHSLTKMILIFCFFLLEINPSPAAILTGHDTEITCLWISAELGIVLSGSEHSLVLQHTLVGDILRSFENPSSMSTPRILSPSNDGDIIVCYDRSKLCLYTLNGKLMRQAIFEDETIQVKINFNTKID
jgi:hypothetical protein